MLNEFIQYLNAQLGQPYVWGGQHTRLRPSDYITIIRQKEEQDRHERNALDFCRNAFINGTKVLYAYDCSGLGMYWLQNLKKLYKHDMNANAMMAECTIVNGHPKKGYWVFRVVGGKANHIGYMIDDNYVIHAKGREYGVIKEAYDAYYWNKIGIPKIFAKEITGRTTSTYIFTRVLKNGCTGEDVKELKKLLIAKGYSGLNITNGNFYANTTKVVKKFQKDNKLTVDGIAGKNTITALGGEWVK